VKIEVVNPIECRISKNFLPIIKPCLTYTGVFYVKVPIHGTDRTRMDRRTYPKDCIIDKDQDHAWFLRGHLDRVKTHLDSKKINYTVSGIEELHVEPKPFKLPGITFRPDQLELMQAAVNHKEQNGVIIAPTGTGKTILQLGIRSAFPQYRCLILAQTIDLVQQIVGECEKFGFNAQKIGGGKKFEGDFTENTVVSTIQSFQKIPIELYMTEFPLLLVDEAHHISNFTGRYAKVLRNLISSIKLGFTATLPTEEEAQMALEGYIGPVIGEQTINEAAELEILAVPTVKLLKTEYSQRLHDIRKYQAVYEEGIVNSRERNELIVNTILECKKKGEICLIFVNRIEHGNNLVDLFKRIGKTYVPFVQGEMKGEERLNIKNSLISGKRKIAIATTAWKEGINIPSLNVIFNGGGGKDDLGVLQTIGRGLRRTNDKDTVVIYDIFDPSHHFLVSHFGQRITLYMENEWL